MSLLRRQFLSLLASSSTLAMSTANAESASPDMPHVPWSRQAAIYEINVCQFTTEGTLRAAMADLPRLKGMGVDILWLMPIQPIGKLNRNGTLGSYYSIRDHTAVNAEFGTLADARAFVQAAHAQGMKVILDWVANHTAFDHPWTREHRDWYKLDARGQIFPVTFNAGQPNEEHWSDVTALNYDRPALGQARLLAAVEWKTRELQPFYTQLLALKHAHPALANGQYGGALALLDVGNERLFAFKRALGADSVTVVVDLTASEQKLRLVAGERSLPAHGWLIEST